MPKKQEYCEGVWDTLTFVINHLNTYESKDIKKKAIYQALMNMRPADVIKSTEYVTDSY